jgi:nucleoside-diphosphate-sugar epimerase
MFLRGAPHFRKPISRPTSFLYRRVDVADVVSAHLLAMEKAAAIGFDRFVISATTPFTRDDLVDLGVDAPAVLRRRVPGYEAVYAACGWKMLPALDRVYVNERARAKLGWSPRYDFQHILSSLSAGVDPRSELARAIGSKGYHPP